MQINQYGNNISYANYSQNNQQSFGSKKALIKKLSDVNMLAMREFPVHSNTRMEHYNTRYGRKIDIYNYVDGLISEIRGFSKYKSSPKEVVLKSIDAVKQNKVGNCGELADIALVTCRINGIKNAKTYSLYAYNPDTRKIRAIDHTVVGVNMKKPSQKLSEAIGAKTYLHDRESIIVDPWAGFVDYECNATPKYKNDTIFGIKLSPEDKICYVENGLANGLGKTDILFLKHEYPELSKTKKFSFMEKIRWALLDKTQYEYEKMGSHIKESYRHNAHFKKALTTQQLTDLLTNQARSNSQAPEEVKPANKNKLLRKFYNKLYNLVFPNK
jgi:hypothetical protein